MKKSLSILLALAMTFAMMTGCAQEPTGGQSSASTSTGSQSSASSEETPKSNYPERQITILVPYSAGGGGDLITRAAAEWLSDYWGVPVMVENRKGSIATGKEYFYGKETDGYTAIMMPSGEVSCHMANNINPEIDIVNDAWAVCRLFRIPIGYYVKADSPYKTFEEFCEYYKDHPTELTWGSSSMTGPAALEIAQLCDAIGIDFNDTTMISINGSADGATKVAGGHIVTAPGDISAAQALVEAGELINLAVAPFKHEYYPEIPTAEECGIEGLTYSNGSCLWLHKDCPDDVKAAWQEAVTAMHADPAWAEALKQIKQMDGFMDHDELTEFIKGEVETYTEIAETYGLRQ